MSIEEEIKTTDNNKNETIDNNIINKINLKQIKTSILSPPDTPQINNIKKDIDNEQKFENIKTEKEQNGILKEREINESSNNLNKEKNNGQIKNNEKEKILESKEDSIKENSNLINENIENKSNSKILMKTNNIEKNNINNNNNKNENDLPNNNNNNIEENNNNENEIKKINEKLNDDVIKEKKNTVSNSLLENKNDASEESSLNDNKNSITETSSTKLNNTPEISENKKVIVKLDKLKNNNKIRKMTRSEINICTNITRSLQLHQKSFPFLKPVDPVLLNIPDYFTIIKKPMDLSTIKEKIKGNKYSDINDYISDVELMFNNCFKYNPPSNPVHIAGIALRNYFIEQLRRLSPEVQASLKILTIENNDDYLYVNSKRPKRQIKTVQHLEPEIHIAKKMKVINTTNSDSIKEEKVAINERKKLGNVGVTNDNKKDVIILSKSNTSEKINSIKPIKIQEHIKKINENKNAIKKLISTSHSSKLSDLSRNKYNKNGKKLNEEEEEDEIEEEQETEDDIEVKNDEEEEIEDNEEEGEEDEEEDDDNATDNLNYKTKSIIKASQKVISKMRQRSNDNKIRNISAKTSSISKRQPKSRLIKSMSKAPSLSSIPIDQVYQSNLSENLVEMQINTLTMCLQKVTRQLELLQVQSKARKLKKKAKRLAKSLNMEEYDLQSDSDSVEDIISQTSLLTNNANKMLKRKTKAKIINKKPKINKIRNQQQCFSNENDMIDENEKSDKINDQIEEENRKFINKKKGKSVLKEKIIKKESKNPKQRLKPENKNRKRIPKDSQENSYDIKKICEYCGDTDTPMWRRGPNGKGTLCNKCGVKWKGGKIYQGEEIPIKKNKNLTNELDNSTVIQPQTKKERKKNKTKDKKKENIKNKSKQQKITEITYNQKKELSEMINYLSEEKISGVVDIIKSSIPDIKDTQEEIELDIETINPATLYKLYNYVKKVSKPKNSRKNNNKNDDTSSGESSGESTDSEDESSDSDSDSNQFLSRH